MYVRIFNKTAETQDIDDPSRFCKELIGYIWSKVSSDVAATPLTPLGCVHFEYAVEALRTLAESRGYVPFDVANCPHGIECVLTRHSDQQL